MRNCEKNYVEQIRTQYKEREITKLDELKRLDRKVKNPAKIFAYIFGTVGSLVLGVGMCLAMKVIFDLLIPGIVIGVLGIVMVSATYFLYNKILDSRKKRYADEVIELSNSIINSNLI